MQIRSFWPQWDLGEKAGGDSSGEYYRLYNREEGAEPKEAMMLVIDIPQDPAETAGLRSAGLDADGIRVYYDKKAREIVRNTGRFMHMRKGDTILPVRACDYEPHTDGPGMRIYVLMDRLAGLEPFMESVSEDGHADPWAVVCLAADLCGALEYCAENGMVHGGIRPSAVFVREDGTFMLGSFDLSGRHIAAGNEPFSINELSLYMAPEQASGAARNGQTDLYSAAMIIYRYFNHGRLPFYPLWPDPVSPADMMRAQTRRMQGTPVPGPDDTDPQMAEILKKACDPDPEKRYESAADLRAAILHWAWDHNYLHIAPGGRKEEEGDHYDRLTERYVLNPDTVPGAERMPDMSGISTGLWEAGQEEEVLPSPADGEAQTEDVRDDTIMLYRLDFVNDTGFSGSLYITEEERMALEGAEPEIISGETGAPEEAAVSGKKRANKTVRRVRGKNSGLRFAVFFLLLLALILFFVLNPLGLDFTPLYDLLRSLPFVGENRITGGMLSQVQGPGF